MSSAVDVARKRLRKKRRPFLTEAGEPLLLHVSHHKVGTVWFMRVLAAVSKSYDLRFEVIGRNLPTAGSEVFLFNNAFRFKREYFEGKNFRGSHIVRDPRDLVVSAYHYHLRTTEEWALTPSQRWGGQSYQEYLRMLDDSDALLAEISRSASSEFKSMREWNYTQPEFLELRYEDVLKDESSAFDRLFRHYGFSDSECEASVELARSFSLDVVRAGKDSHVRSGQPGEWRETFKPEHISAFKEATGDLLVRLGYESTTDW